MPAASESGAPSREFNDVDFRLLRDELLARVQAENVFGPLPQAALAAKGPDALLVVFLTGLITMADWIGSDETFFALQDPTPERENETLTQANKQAQRAVADLRWGETTPVPTLSFGDLFGSTKGRGYAPNPLQTMLAEMVAARAGLYVVEAPMGGGKTEAALHAAYLRWTTGGERGLYFALPTQLTSNRIYERVNRFLARAVEGPSLSTLVHGSAWLRQDRAIEIHPTDRSPEDAADAADARHWFASGRRALLAPFGAGTLDQALLSVLPAKHCGLRLFALAGKVVVCDEVHSYDPYTSRLLEELIGNLMRLGGTVIVLTATLAASRKAALLRAAGAASVPSGTGYPLITALASSGGHPETREIAPDPADIRSVEIEHCSEDDPTLWERACEAAEAGACVLIVRNTVARAQEAWRALRCTSRDGGPEVALLHSRFPRWRRDELEDVWLRRLGKFEEPGADERHESRPKGCLLVATQIVEQSVDIDADLLITDLAPTDLLLQRMGRLHRHATNERPSGFAAARAWIIQPVLDETMDARQIKERLGASGRVYPPATMFRTWQLWRERTSVLLPQEIRPLLDATYAPLADDAPAGLRSLNEELAVQVTKRIDTAAAKLDRLGGIRKDDRDDGTLTRWREQPTADLLLLSARPSRSSDGQWDVSLLDGAVPRINPYQWRLPVAQALHRNVVRVPLYTVREWLAAAPSYLADYFEGGVAVGVVDGEEVLPIEESSAQSYRLSWNEDEGISLRPIEGAKTLAGRKGDGEGGKNGEELWESD